MEDCKKIKGFHEGDSDSDEERQDEESDEESDDGDWITPENIEEEIEQVRHNKFMFTKC